MAVSHAVSGKRKASFDEIEVGRIDVRESDGTMRMIISGSDAAPGVIVKGKEIPHPDRKSAGILFYNDEGTENGGLIFGGAKKDGKVTNYGHLSFDQYEQDQVVVLEQNEEDGERYAMLSFWDRPDAALPWDLIQRSNSAEGRAELAKRGETGGWGYQRLSMGKTKSHASMVSLKDAEGRPRLVMQVTATGAASIDFLDVRASRACKGYASSYFAAEPSIGRNPHRHSRRVGGRLGVLMQLRAWVAWCAMGAAFAAFGADVDSSPRVTGASISTSRDTDLRVLLREVGNRLHKHFVLDPRASVTIDLGGLVEQELTYPQLLAVLQINGMSVVPEEGIQKVIANVDVRQETFTIADPDNIKTLDEEWITMVIPVKNISAAQLVPILRPLIPQWGHLSAYPDRNALIIVDRTANVRRLIEVIRVLEKLPKAPEAAAPAKSP